MARPRFLDRLSPERRAEIEPELHRLIDAGASPDDLLRWAVQEKLQVSRATLANHMRERKGPSAEDPARRVRREVQGGGAVSAEVEKEDPGAAPGSATAEEPEPELDLDDPAARRRVLVDQIRATRKILRTDPDPKNQLAASKLQGDLMAMLQDMDKADAGDDRPRVVFYFPERTALKHLEADE